MGEALRSQDYEGQDYEGFWTGPAMEALDRLERKIVAAAVGAGGRVVDVGAGFGRLAPAYLDRFREVHLVEPASNLRAAAERRLGARARFHDAEVYRLPFEDGFFDAAVMIRVFHHLSAPEAALRELRRVLSPGGRLVLGYSNKRNPKRVLKFLIGRAPNPFSPDTEAYLPSLFGHHPRFVRALLDRVGFAAEAEYGVGVADKLVGLVPALSGWTPSVAAARRLGRLALAPSQIVAARKR